MTSITIQNGANLAQAVGKEYSKISKNMAKSKKRKRKHKNEKNVFCSNVRQVLQNSDGSTARRLLMFYENK